MFILKSFVYMLNNDDVIIIIFKTPSKKTLFRNGTKNNIKYHLPYLYFNPKESCENNQISPFLASKLLQFRAKTSTKSVQLTQCTHHTDFKNRFWQLRTYIHLWNAVKIQTEEVYFRGLIETIITQSHSTWGWHSQGH